MGRRARARGQVDRLRAPEVAHDLGDGDELVLRGALSPSTRRGYASALAGDGRPAATREDAWARATELLFEHLAVRWTVNGVPTEGQRDLLARYRAATAAERRTVRDALRAHLAEHFPEMEAP